MKRKKLKLLILPAILVFLLFSLYSLAFRNPKLAFSAVPGNVVINEVAWAGTVASDSDEWIELHNTSGADVDLTGWTLSAVDGTPTIALSGTIPAGGYYLLERTDDTAVNDVTANLFFTGAVENTDEVLELKNASDALVDTANSNGGAWPAGDSVTSKSMERINPFLPDVDDNWATNNGSTINGTDVGANAILGTPKSVNSALNLTLSITPTPEPTATESPTETPSEPPSPTLTPTTEPSPTETVTPSPEPTTTPTEVPSPTITPMPTIHFIALLNGGSEVPPTTSTASGTVDFDFDPNDNTFDLNAVLSGIGITDLTGSHIHSGAVGGEGAIIVDLNASAWTEEDDNLRRVISGMSFPTDFIDELLAGNTYINAHTTANPDGEIRGQLVTSTPSPSITPTLPITPTTEPSPTEAPSPTITPTVEPTPTETPTPVPTEIPSVTVTPTETLNPTMTPTPSPEPTITVTPSPEPSATPSEAPSPTSVPTEPPSPTNVPTQIPTATVTPVPSLTPSPTPTPSTPPGILIARFGFPRGERTECRLTFKKINIFFSFMYLPEVSCVKK